jgi:hypothetical protein
MFLKHCKQSTIFLGDDVIASSRKLVLEVAVEWPDTEILPFLAVARAEESSRMVVVGMVVRGLKWMWF